MGAEQAKPPRTKQPPEVYVPPGSAPMGPVQYGRLHDWDCFIQDLKTEKPMTLRERWDMRDKELIEGRKQTLPKT